MSKFTSTTRSNSLYYKNILIHHSNISRRKWKVNKIKWLIKLQLQEIDEREEERKNAVSAKSALEEALELRLAHRRPSAWLQRLRLHHIRPAALHPQLHRARHSGSRGGAQIRRVPLRRQQSLRQGHSSRRRGPAHRQVQRVAQAAHRWRLLQRQQRWRWHHTQSARQAEIQVGVEIKN